MSDRVPSGPAPAPLDSVLLFREVDRVDRRIDQVERNLTTLDEHGSRGLEGLKVQVGALSERVGHLDETFGEFRRDLKSGRWQLIAAYIAGLVPIYVFLAQQLLK